MGNIEILDDNIGIIPLHEGWNSQYNPFYYMIIPLNINLTMMTFEYIMEVFDTREKGLLSVSIGKVRVADLA